MVKRTREKIALLIFFSLIIGGGVVLLSYFATGLSWVVAASYVDDNVGALEGYTAVVYPGTKSIESSDSTALNVSSDPSNNDNIVARTDTMGLRILSYYPVLASSSYEGVFVSDVHEYYCGKNANVISLNTSDPSYYEDPVVIETKDKKVGVFAADSYMTRSNIIKTVNALKESDADSIICITPRLAMLSTFTGIDVVVLTSETSNIPASGRRDGDTLIVSAPNEGEVGVVLFSYNNVPSARKIDAL